MIESQAPPVVEDLTPVKDTVDFPLGSAIDSRETTGASSELLLRHFDQVTPENHMKPEAWYDEARAFGSTPRPRRSWTTPRQSARLQPHTGLAQPDPGMVPPTRGRHAAHEQCRRPGNPSEFASTTISSTWPNPERNVWAVRQRHQPARRLRPGRPGRFRWRDRARWPPPQSLVQRPRRDVHRRRLRVCVRSLQRDVCRGRCRPPRDAGDQRLQHRAVRQARAHARHRRTPARSRRPGRRGRPPVPPEPVDAGRDARGGDHRVRGPAGDAGRQRDGRDDRHAGRRRPSSSTRATTTATPSGSSGRTPTTSSR